MKSSNYIVCEDTRSLKNLLNALEIDFSDKTIDSFHDQSGEGKLKRIVNLLKDGKDIVYCSEAGSPIISDPAYPLVKSCIEKNIKIQSYSGVTSVMMALELVGLPITPFTFKGFLPREKSAIKNEFAALIKKGTYVYFESPYRILDTLKLLKSQCEHCEVGLARELSKKFESIYRFNIQDLEQNIDDIEVRGEFVLVVHVNNEQNQNPYIASKAHKLAQDVLEKPNKRKLSKLLGELTGITQDEIYKILANSKS